LPSFARANAAIKSSLLRFGPLSEKESCRAPLADCSFSIPGFQLSRAGAHTLENHRETRQPKPNSRAPWPLPEQERLVDDARLMLTDVAEQLLAGVSMPEPSAIDHIKTFALVAACEASSVSGRPVVMAEFYEERDIPQRWLTAGAAAAGAAAL
jgi:hypothetical protein